MNTQTGTHNTPEPLLTPAQVVELLSVGSTRSLESWRRRGEGPPFVRVGKQVRYRASDLQAWLAAQTVGAPARVRT
jgi:predicted DNA-binding transcriptional regulator AlpA